MSTLASLLHPQNIELDLAVADKGALFAHLAQRAAPLAGVAQATVVESLRERESAGSTGLGMGVAIPHGRLKGLKGGVVLFSRLSTPIDFDSPDGKPVSLVFTLLVPANAEDLHLQLLGELAQNLGSPAFRQRLAEAVDPAAVIRAFATSEP